MEEKKVLVEKDSRIIYVDLLKIISIFGVVIIHICSMMFYREPVGLSWNAYNIWDSICRWCVPIFVMCSGMFFLDPKKDISIKKIYTKYIPRIIIAIIVWGLFYMITLAFLNHTSLNIIDIIKNFLKANTNYHLWFLYMIAGLYIVTPIIRKLVQNCERRYIEYFLILWFLITGLFPVIFSFKTFSVVKPLIDSFDLTIVRGFVGYFVLGYYLKNYDISKLVRRLLYVLGIIALIMTPILTYYLSIRAGKPIETLYSYLSPNVIIIASALVVFFKYSVGKINFSARVKKHILNISKCSFGVYLVHVFFIYILEKYSIMPNIISPIIGVPLFGVGIYLISLLVSYIINKIPILNKYIV